MKISTGVFFTTLATVAQTFAPGAARADLDRCAYPFEQKCRDVIAKGTDPVAQRAELELARSILEAMPEVLKGRKHLGELYDAFLSANGYNLPPTSAEVGSAMMKAAVLGHGAVALALPPVAKQIPEVELCPKLEEGKPETDAAVAKLEDLAFGKSTTTALYNQYYGDCAARANQEAIKKSPELQSLCSDDTIQRLKYAVIDDFALENSSQHDKEKQKALSKELSDGAVALRKALHSSVDRCKAAAAIVTSDVNTANAVFQDSVRMSKPLIRAVEKRFFTAESRAALLKLVEEEKAGVLEVLEKEILPRSTLAASEQTRLRDEFKALPLNEVPAKDDSAFSARDGFPVDVFEPDTLLGSFAQYVDPFADRKYKNFTVYNAYYFPGVKQGNLVVGERMAFLPSLWLQAKVSTDGLRFVIAHELGHKIDPRVTRPLKGMSDAYKPLVDCLAKIGNVEDYQIGEAFADWLSARVNGQRFVSLAIPQAQVDDFLQDFCLEDNDGLNLESSDVHPDMRLRRMYIFGRDPLMRQAMGCPRVASCGLNGIEQ